jgi:DNA-binding LacI/PurR family transcriptional regulator
VNDLTALGLIQGLAREGVRVPQDLTVVGYDNLVLTEVHEAGLPTVEAHLPRLYVRALDVLIQMVQGDYGENHEVLAPEFVSG